MSDNTPQLPQLAVLGFSDQPGPVGNLGVGNLGGSNNGPSAIHQRWFVFRDGQFHPTAPTAGTNLDSDSDSDSDPNRQPNICFITVALLSGPAIAHHTEQLDACINISDMDQFASKVAEIAPGKVAEIVFSKVAEIASGALVNDATGVGDGVAKVVRELSPLSGHNLYIAHIDGSLLIYTDGNGNGTGTGHEAFLHALDRSADRAIAQSLQQCTGAITILAVTFVVWLTMAAAMRRQRG
ncbi:hypothetical protein F5883DRAFT_644921 [Diaporthe sp. PMI_573]|nr:hypothetical protein F5883DRAFT_644921 [Diaporthaceae sp. PMI_573]